MAPVVRELAADADLESRVCITAQHREMLDQVLQALSITPDIDLNLMTAGQSLAGLGQAVLGGMDKVLAEEKPDLVLVMAIPVTQHLRLWWRITTRSR